MSQGCDYAFPPHPSIAALKAASITFVMRYFGGSKDKDLTRAEADALHAGGIAIGSNWESTTGAARGGYNQGVADARAAQAQHAAAGGPADRPIYFSVDWDVQTSELAVVGAYFRGVASIIGLARTGAYGGYRVIRHLLDNHLITWAWQTYAWSGGQWDPRVHIRQTRNGVVIGGADCDLDTGMVADIGQWPFTGGDDVSAHTDAVIDAWRNGNQVAADGTSVEPVKWEIRRSAREQNADKTQAAILTAVQALTVPDPAAIGKALAGDQTFVAAVAAALAGLVPTVEELRAAVDAAVKARLDGATVHTAGS